MNSTPEPDAVLLDARDLALAALREITAESSIGPAAGYRVESDGVVSLRFENRLGGYPGWYWTVSVARVEEAEPTVLEAELLPGDGALLAPEWVPWAERLADYQAAQAALAETSDAEGDEPAADAGDEQADDLEDVDDLDEADFDTDGSPILHAGDVDGVDIDELADEVGAGDADDGYSDDDDEDDSDDDDEDDSDDDLDDDEDDSDEDDDSDDLDDDDDSDDDLDEDEDDDSDDDDSDDDLDDDSFEDDGEE